MIAELVLAFFLGILAGTFTGLIPGIHINLVASVLLSFPLLLVLDPSIFLVFVVSMAITHTFVDFIPSIFLGAPHEDTALGVLPGHKFLLKGQGYYALRLTLVGSLMGVVGLMMVLPLLWLFLDSSYGFIQQMMGFLLIWVVILLFLGERYQWRASLIIFLLSGFLGVVSLNAPSAEPLLPLFSGLFGASTLIHSLRSHRGLTLPFQEQGSLIIDKQELVKPGLVTLIISPLCSIFPGLGSSQAAIIGSKVAKRMNREQFLVLLGSINTLVMGVSFFTLFLLGRTRTGAAAAIKQVVGTEFSLLLILLVILFSSVFAYLIARIISAGVARKISSLPYTRISLIVLLFLAFVVGMISGGIGLLIFVTSTVLGLLCIELDVRKSFLMGCLLVPTIIFYLPF